MTPLPSDPLRIFISCGETSGDIHAAELLRSLRKYKPELSCDAMTGPALLAAGATRLHGIEELSVMGGTEILSAIPRALRMLTDIRRRLESARPAAIILVDAPEFNFRVAAMAHKLRIPVYYYISPKIWAWRTGRVHFLKKHIRKIISILPFEVDFYAGYGVNIDYVGSPLIDIIDPPSLDVISINDKHIGIMPGSRKKEISSLLPEFGLAARVLLKSHPDLKFLCLRAPNITESYLRSFWPEYIPLTLIEPEERYRAIKSCAIVLAASGTATLECAIIGTPTIAAYKLSRLSYAVAKRLVKVRWMSLANLIFKETVMPELLQDDACGANMAKLAAGWLSNPKALAENREKLLGLREMLGPPGSADRAAAVILQDLGCTL